MVLDASTVEARPPKWIQLGHPSYVWRFGQDRRFALIRAYTNLENKKILDVGCGVGMYVRKFREFSEQVYGVDVDLERVAKAQSATQANCSVAPAEALPFPDGFFDTVLLHEVIEHVKDDRVAVAEALRVLAPGGRLVIFAPNRLYLFETHGIYVGKRYIFKLIPFVNYLPNPLRNRFCPHVRAYTKGAIKRLWADQPARVVVHTYVYPGFDNIASRHRILAGGLRRFLYLAEGTPLRTFGLSHFVVLEKTA
jgi:SAM-dependent methyltransferase